MGDEGGWRGDDAFSHRGPALTCQLSDATGGSDEDGVLHFP